MRNLKAMLDMGHLERVMVSHDSVNCWMGSPGPMSEADLRAAMPNWNVTHIFENIFPELEAMGVACADLDRIVIDNPRRYFEAARSSARQV